MTNTKIICTLGPASSDTNTIKELILSGADVFRINMSHGDHDNARKLIQTVRQVSSELGRMIPVFMDLQGKKLRTGIFENDSAELIANSMCIITTEKITGTAERFSTDYKGLCNDMKPGDCVLIDDGKVVLEVIQASETEIRCRIVTGGTVKSRKGLMLPGKEINLPALSTKDIADAKCGLEIGVDGFMLSFVQKASDIIELQEIMKSCGSVLPVIAKIESAKGIENLLSIADIADAILVARGDLGVELPVWELPPVQVKIIDTAKKARKPVIVATEMLESMITNSRPTRAEVSDVASAVTQGADVVMLSGETAVGKYPVKAVTIMDRTLEQAEILLKKPAKKIDPESPHLLAECVSFSAVDLSKNLNAQAIVIYTHSGFTARQISHFAPIVPIYVFSSDIHIARICNLFRGTQTFLLPEKPESFESFLEQSIEILVKKELIRKKDTIVAVNVTGKNNDITHANSIKVFNC
ncbi:MAG TPA: pyruvate kinase [bacterium]|nr:pyruvate kinase [bacterium]